MRHHALLATLLLLVAASTLSAQITWDYAGGPNAAIVTSIAFDAGGDTYLGTFNGALYRLHHGETRWTHLFGDLPDARKISALHAAPDGAVYAANSYGPIRRSTDHGATWTKIAPPPPPTVAIESDSIGTLLAGGDDGLYGSTDQGNSWRIIDSISQNGAFSIAAGPAGKLYALHRATFAPGDSRLRISTDNGGHWSESSDPLVGKFEQIAVMTDGTLLATGSGVYRSDDGGNTWRRLFALSRSSSLDVRGNLALLATGDDIRTSTDGGASWTTRVDGLAGQRPDVAAIAPTGELMAGAYPGGAYIAAGAGAPWTPASNGLRDMGFTRFVVTPTGAMLGTLSGRLFRSTDKGRNWTLTGVEGWAPRDLVVAGPEGSAYVDAFERTADGVYIASGLLRSTDEGATWQGVRTSALTPSAMEVDSNGDVYIGYEDTNPHLIRSTDRGVSWRNFSPDSLPGRVAAISMLRPGEVMIATSAGSLFAYRKMGSSTLTLQNVNVRGTVNRIIRTGAGSLLASSAGTGVIRSTDEGETWSTANVGLPSPIVATLQTASDGSALVAGRYFGIFRSIDGGLTWRRAGDGLTDSSVVDLGLGPDGALYASTATGGIFASTTLAAVTSPIAGSDHDARLDIVPNPAAGVATLRYHAKGSGPATITITDPLGREVMRLADADAIDGARSLPLNLSTLVDGVYFCRVDQGGASSAMKIVVTR